MTLRLPMACFDTDIRFNGTVRRVSTLVRYEGPVFVVHFDPRFVVEIEIRDIDPPESILDPGIACFAIHSPAMLFGTSSAEDKTFDFLLQRSGLLSVEW
jgi:hypothetical protein